jgi:membrane-associated phospholipid phosphatase
MMGYLSQLMRCNRWFFGGFLLFLLIGGVLLLLLQEGKEIFFFSDKRSYATDLFFRFFTNLGDGAIFVIALIILPFWRFRTAIVMFLLGLSVLITSSATKQIFSQPRPYRYFEERDLLDEITFVDGVRLAKGTTSFPSGHTMTGFAFYAFLALIIPRKKWMGLLLLLTAILVGVSRMYLVQHFLSDVYLGAITGVMLAIIFHYIHNHYFRQPWADRALLSKKAAMPEA